MRLPRWWTFALVATVLNFFPLPLRAQADKPRVTLTPREPWTNYFAAKDLTLHFTVQATEAFQGRAVWAFSVGPAVVTRKEVPLAVAPNKPAQLTIQLPGPEVRAGVVLDAKLAVQVFAERGDKPEASHLQTLRFFPPDPFTDRTKWLKELQITLFDPKGTTAELCKKMAIPFEESRNVAALAELKEGLIVVGEGVSFQEERGLGEALFAAAAKGRRVLCLAPAEGSLPIPTGEGADAKAAPLLAFRHQDMITRLDKRLDSHVWSADKAVVVSRLVLKGEGASVGGEIVRGPGGWPWLEARFADTGGRFVFCGFGVVSQWEASPAPRFLLLRLLEMVTEKEERAPAQEREDK